MAFQGSARNRQRARSPYSLPAHLISTCRAWHWTPVSRRRIRSATTEGDDAM